MDTLVVSFPDFIGHPLCLSKLCCGLTKEAHIINVNYSQYWPYCSAKELAELIPSYLSKYKSTFLVGYSFGGIVAFEYYKRIIKSVDGLHQKIYLVMIDSQLINKAQGSGTSEFDASDLVRKIASKPEYNYLKMLIELEEIDIRSIQGNLEYYRDYNNLESIEEAWFLTAKTAQNELVTWKSVDLWSDHIRRIHRIKIEANHFEIARDEECINEVQKLIRTVKGVPNASL